VPVITQRNVVLCSRHRALQLERPLIIKYSRVAGRIAKKKGCCTVLRQLRCNKPQASKGCSREDKGLLAILATQLILRSDLESSLNVVQPAACCTLSLACGFFAA